jgi:imidazole glycerol phosphate synthase glutamine amidotransferase subunit
VSASVRVALVDYGAGNLASVEKALAHVGFTVLRAGQAADLDAVHALVIPGVGHFSATGHLDETFRTAIARAVDNRQPVLGVCLGLQVLFEGSDEAPGVPGLGILAGRCVRLEGDVKVPHVGWNTMEVSRPSRLLSGIDRADVYFTHSYAAPVTDAAVAVTTHGVPFASVVERGALFAVQWHPEKSGEAGLHVLRTFREIAASC